MRRMIMSGIRIKVREFQSQKLRRTAKMKMMRVSLSRVKGMLKLRSRRRILNIQSYN
jgi:hypothetical protein